MSDGDIKTIRNRKQKRDKIVEERRKESLKYHETVWKKDLPVGETESMRELKV